EGCGLELDADARLDSLRVVRLLEAEAGDAARVRHAQPLDHLNGSGLACAVGTEHTEDLAFGHGKADAVHRLRLAVALAQILDHDGIGLLRHQTIRRGYPRPSGLGRKRRPLSCATMNLS